MSNQKYEIDLSFNNTPASKQALKELSSAFERADGDVNALKASYKTLAEGNVNAGKQYEQVLADQTKALQKQIDQLDAERVAILANAELTEEERSAQLEQNKVDQKKLKAKKKALEVELKLKKLTGSVLDENSKMYKISSNLVKAQMKMNELLGKESKLRKGISKVASVGAKVGKVAAAGVGGAMAIGGAIIGGAASAANGQVDKERALQSLKTGIDPSVVDEAYIKTGADYASIVNAVNGLADITKDNGLLVQGAMLELQNAGIGKLLLSTTKHNGETNEGNIPKLAAALLQIKKQTGIQDLSAALEASTHARRVTDGRVSQVEYVQAYSSLAQAGLDEETINRVIRSVADKGGDFIERFNSTDVSKYVYDRQLKTRIQNSDLTVQKLDLDRTQEKSSAESVAESMRRLELKKDELMVKVFMPLAERILKIIDSPEGQAIIDGLIDFLTKAVPVITDIVMWLWDKVKAGVEVVKKAAHSIMEQNERQTTREVEAAQSRSPARMVAARSGFDRTMAMGGVTDHPSIVGEAGPELVLPLDYGKAGRTSNIVNNYQSTFNIATPSPTNLALAQSMNHSRFIKRAIAW